MVFAVRPQSITAEIIWVQMRVMSFPGSQELPTSASLHRLKENVLYFRKSGSRLGAETLSNNPVKTGPLPWPGRSGASQVDFYSFPVLLVCSDMR